MDQDPVPAGWKKPETGSGMNREILKIFKLEKQLTEDR